MANELFKGLKVVDAGSWIAGPVASTMLADYGADVTKIEIPGDGDAYRRLAHGPGTPNADINYAWAQDARNKRSITLNLKTDAGQAILKQLVAPVRCLRDQLSAAHAPPVGADLRRLAAAQSAHDLRIADGVRRIRTGEGP